MAERQIEHRKSSLVVFARRSVAKSALLLVPRILPRTPLKRTTAKSPANIRDDSLKKACFY